jgi:hypothetical protein
MIYATGASPDSGTEDPAKNDDLGTAPKWITRRRATSAC